MTEQDDNLKDLFRDKTLENAFSPDEQNWEKMAAVLKNERQSRKRLLVYLSMLLISAGIGTWLFMSQAEKPTKSLSFKPQESSREKKLTDSNEKNTESAKKGALPLKAGKPVPGHTASGPAAPVRSEISVPEFDRSKPVNAALIKEPIQIAAAPAQADLKTGDKEQDSRQEKEQERGVLKSSLPEKQEVTVITHKEPVPGKEELPTFPEVSETNSAKGSENKGKIAVEAPLSTVEDKPVQSFPQPIPVEKTDAVLNPIYMAKNLTDSSMTEIAALSTPGLQAEKKDSTLAAQVLPKDSLPSKINPSQWIFLEAGTSYLLGWKANSKTEARGFNPLIGIHYYHEVTKKIGLSVGLQYTSINNLSATNHTSTSSKIRFGEESEVTVVSARSMHYALMPLKASCQVSESDQFSIGYTLAYLIDVNSKVETYTTGFGASAIHTVTRSMGYTKGFSPYDGQIAIAYRRRLNKKLYINGEFFYGLKDIKNNNIYAATTFERASGFRLSLGFNLWKK